jgi:hypothetical protein
MSHRLAHCGGRSSQATSATVDKSPSASHTEFLTTPAQGSQFKRVVVVIAKSRLLDHSLIYTALTRGVEQVVFLGARAPFELAVLSPPSAQRRDVAFVL